MGCRWGAGLEDTMENQTECLSLIAAVFVSVPPSPKAFQENNLKEAIIPALTWGMASGSEV